MTRFQLTVIDEDHMILASTIQMSRLEYEGVLEAFDKWKERGGALIISDCLIVDRHAITVDLDIETTVAKDVTP